MNDSLIFRQATMDDLKDIMKLYFDAISAMVQNNIFQWDEMYPDHHILAQDILNEQLYIGSINGKTASAFVLNQSCDEAYKEGKWQYPEAAFYVLHRLCVAPSFQNKGIAKNTMLYLESILKAKHVQVLRLDAFFFNPIALRLYENLGYQKVGIVNFRKGPFFLMEKKL